MKFPLLTSGIFLFCTTLVVSQEDVCKDIDLTIILDHSGSIFHIPHGWHNMTTFTKEVIEGLYDRSVQKDSQVALFTYNDDYRLVFNLGELDKDNMVSRVNELMLEEPRGYTNSSGVLYAARNMVFTGKDNDRPDYENVLLFVTDGKPTKGFREDGEIQIVDDHDFTPNGIRIRNNLFNQVREQAGGLRDDGTRIVIAGLSDNINVELLDEISDYFMYKESPMALLDSVFDITSVVCESRTVTTTTPQPTTTTTTPEPTTTTTTTPQPTTTTEPTPLPVTECYADIAILVDASGSIRDAAGGMANWEEVKTFLENLVQTFGDIGEGTTNVALILFSSNVFLTVELGNTDKDTLLTEIQNLQHLNAWTATAPALRLARTGVFETSSNRENAENFLILLTDGKPTRYLDGAFRGDKNDPGDNLLKDEVRSEAALLNDLNVTIVVVGVTDNVDTDLMLEIVDTADDYLMVDNFDDLGQTQIGQLRNRACGPITTPLAPLPGCSIDLVVLVDASGSIQDAEGGVNNWNSVKTFVSNFVVGFLGIPDTILHVSIICYSDEVTTPLAFGESTEEEIRTVMDNLDYKGGYTATAAALQTAYTDVFNSGVNRANAADFAVLMTDGYPTRSLTGETLEKSELGTTKQTLFNREVLGQAQLLKDLGVTIIGLAVTDETDDVLLNQIVTSPVGDFFKVDAFSELEMEDFGMEIRDRTCQ